MSPLEAAFNLYINTPPERIHTHIKMFHARELGRRMGPIPNEIVAEVKAMFAQGIGRSQILRSLKMGVDLYTKILHLIQSEMTLEQRMEQIKQLSARNITTRRMVSITGLSQTTIKKYLREIRASNDRYKDIPTL